MVPARGGLTGWAALRWLGGRWFDGTAAGGRDELPVPIVAPGADLRAQQGICVGKELLGAGDVVSYDGMRLTTAVWSVVFAMRRAPSVVEAVVAADMAAFSDLASIAEMSCWLDTHPGAIGNPLARRAMGLAHENSWSPMETRWRMVWRLVAGLPSPAVNSPVFDLDGRHLATPDLLDIEAGLAIEYDGAEHHGGARRLTDSRREDTLRDAGLSYLTVLGGELHDRRRLADRLRRARSRATASTSSRRWTSTTPSWWRPLDTVARRWDSRRRNGP